MSSDDEVKFFEQLNDELVLMADAGNPASRKRGS
jgi:hypothetical protein